MPIIGFRASYHLQEEVKRVAEASGKTMSDFLRKLVEDNLRPCETPDWEVIAWNLFMMSPEQITYALTHSRSPEEFFANISHRCGDLGMKVMRTSDSVTVSIKMGEDFIATSFPRSLPKMEGISRAILDLDHRIQKIQLDKLEGLDVESI